MSDLSTVRQALRRPTYVASRTVFLVGAVDALELGRASNLSWAGPVFVITLPLLWALVRYGAKSWNDWADEYVLWLNTGDAQAWIAWHREYVTWSTQHRANFGPSPTGARA